MCVCDLEGIVDPSIFKVIRSVVRTGHGQIVETELLQLQSGSYQFIITDKAKDRRGGGKVSVL